MADMDNKSHPAFSQSTRVCVICGEALRRRPDGSFESTFGFHTALQRLGFDGDKAHPSCVKEEAMKKAEQI